MSLFSVGKAKIEKKSHDLKVKYELLELAMTTVRFTFNIYFSLLLFKYCSRSH